MWHINELQQVALIVTVYYELHLLCIVDCNSNYGVHSIRIYDGLSVN